MAAANKLATTPRPFRPEEAAGEGRLEDFPRTMVAGVRFELTTLGLPAGTNNSPSLLLNDIRIS